MIIRQTKLLIFLIILKKKGIDLDNYLYEERRGEEYLKTTVSKETFFRKDKDKKTYIIANENTKYNCRVLLQIQSAILLTIYVITILKCWNGCLAPRVSMQWQIFSCCGWKHPN